MQGWRTAFSLYAALTALYKRPCVVAPMCRMSSRHQGRERRGSESLQGLLKQAVRQRRQHRGCGSRFTVLSGGDDDGCADEGAVGFEDFVDL